MGKFITGREIGSDTILQRKEDLLFNKIDEEIVMLSVANSQYYGMDKIGTRIWELLEQPKTLSELISKLTEYYDVTEDKCKSDTIAFLIKLDEKKLITFS